LNLGRLDQSKQAAAIAAGRDQLPAHAVPQAGFTIYTPLQRAWEVARWKRSSGGATGSPPRN
jgi:hypothetical protein